MDNELDLRGKRCENTPAKCIPRSDWFPVDFDIPSCGMSGQLCGQAHRDRDQLDIAIAMSHIKILTRIDLYSSVVVTE